ncbi:hypothetical protein CYMTET_51193 [Cymbomonas tetramitiformis]|uniref:Uncharacterized protein n=1 Tax=Cymbomonas tetramitiformis TaxID=36881 RepID=A0AAE0ESW9_9CHLO|nr:hypothetical protein CYMTET_51193 [Cymbomonas tetramitiformis]
MTDEQKGLVSANVADQQPDMNKQFAALAKEIKDKLAQDMDDIKSRHTQGHVHVSLGSTKKMQGFTPMTPEEHQEGNPLKSARSADHLEKEMTLLSALLTSAFRALTQVAAVLHQVGRLNSKKSSKVLAAIDEINTTASLALDVGGAQEYCLDEGDDLPELTDGDEIAGHYLRKPGESKPEAEAAFCDDKRYTRSSLAELIPNCTSALLPCWFGVVSSRSGCQDGVAGTISMEGYEKLKKVTGQALDGEQKQRMNQVQPLCKLRNDSLEQGTGLDLY